MRNVARQLTRELGTEPEPEQIAAAMDVPVERVRELMRWSQDTVSLDTPVGDDGDTNLGDLVADSDAPSPEELVLAALERQRIEGLLNHLDDRSAGIMRARYGLEDGREHSLTEVATPVLAVPGADPPAGDPGARPAARAGPGRGAPRRLIHQGRRNPASRKQRRS